MSSRGRGLALDWMQGATVVLANSSVVSCSATQNSDLFWGLRGAGSNFGIVSSFQFRTFAAPSVATAFLISLDWQTKQQISSGIVALRLFAESNMPPELDLRLQIGAFGSPATPILQGTYYGSASALNATLAALLYSIKGKFTSQSTGGWLDSLRYFSNGVALDQTYPYTAVCGAHRADPHHTNLSNHISARQLLRHKPIPSKPDRNFFEQLRVLLERYSSQSTVIAHVVRPAQSRRRKKRSCAFCFKQRYCLRPS